MNKVQARNMLIDVMKHFSSNPLGLRSINSDTLKGCTYTPSTNKPLSIGCAIGMFISITNAKKLDRPLRRC